MRRVGDVGKHETQVLQAGDWPSTVDAEELAKKEQPCGARASPISEKFGAGAGEGPCAEVMGLITDMIRRL